MGVRNCGELGINLQKIVTRLLANDNLVNLLYYTDKDPLSQPKLSSEQKKTEIVNKLIRIVPKVTDKETSNAIICLYVSNGNKNSQNKEFSDISLVLDVFVPFDQWGIKNSNLRPFAILGEIQNSLDGVNINGLGNLSGGDFTLSQLTDEISVYSTEYDLIEYA